MLEGLILELYDMQKLYFSHFLALCGSAQMVMQKYFPKHWSSRMPNTIQL